MACGTPAWTALLALALLPALARAQGPPRLDPSAQLAPVTPVGPRGAGGVEVGAGTTLVAIFPTVGGHVSVPTSTGLRVEAGTHLLPWLLEDGDDLGLMSQAQLRFPLREGPTRYGILAGITVFTIGDRRGANGEWDFDSGIRPHVGMTWQWQTAPHVDVRLDVHAMVTGSFPMAVPFATFSVVWHRGRVWS